MDKVLLLLLRPKSHNGIHLRQMYQFSHVLSRKAWTIQNWKLCLLWLDPETIHPLNRRILSEFGNAFTLSWVQIHYRLFYKWDCTLENLYKTSHIRSNRRNLAIFQLFLITWIKYFLIVANKSQFQDYTFS